MALNKSEKFAAAAKRGDFESWFKDSVVTDPDGAPLVVFHATKHDVNPQAFAPLSHFGSAQASAAIARANFNMIDRGCPVRTYPVFLNIKNPLRVMDVDLHSLYGYKNILTLAASQTAFAKYEDKKYEEREDGIYIEGKRGFSYCDLKKCFAETDLMPPVSAEEEKSGWQTRMIKGLQDCGYDGFIYRNDFEDSGSTSYITFNAGQVLSAIPQRRVLPKKTYYVSKNELRK